MSFRALLLHEYSPDFVVLFSSFCFQNFLSYWHCLYVSSILLCWVGTRISGTLLRCSAKAYMYKVIHGCIALLPCKNVPNLPLRYKIIIIVWLFANMLFQFNWGLLSTKGPSISLSRSHNCFCASRECTSAMNPPFASSLGWSHLSLSSQTPSDFFPTHDQLRCVLGAEPTLHLGRHSDAPQ